LQMLVHDLLELSKLDDDKIQLEYTKININELVQEILPHIQQQAHYKDIKLEVTVDDDVEVSGDYGLLRQVILNLLSNAVRSEEHTSELQSRFDLVCRLLLEKKNHSKISYA